MMLCRRSDAQRSPIWSSARDPREKPSVLGRGLVGAVLALTLVFGMSGGPMKAAQPRSALVVRNDPGGKLSERVEQLNRIRLNGTQVRIESGYCNSACTMYLGLPNTCISRNVTFGFHGPMSQFYGMALPPDEFEHWSQVMASYYPSPLRDWYLREARYTTVGLRKVAGRTLIAMGVRECR